MSWDNEAEQGFPPPRHREPTALRRDILDELTDHLAQAAEREWDTGSQDEQEVRSRVLTQFGNPAAVARALWWDAMKETVMKDWIQISISAVLCIGVVGFMALIYGQMQSSNAALLSALNERPVGVENLNPSVEFVFHRGSVDGPVAEGVDVQFTGKPFTEDKTQLQENSDHQGHVRFGPVRAGQYHVSFSDMVTGMSTGKQFTLYSGDGTKTFHIPIPTDETVALNLSFPPEIANTSSDIRLLVNIATQWKHDGQIWDGRNDLAIVTPEGLFQALESGNALSSNYRPGELITRAYGNIAQFKGFSISHSRAADDGDGKRFEQIYDERFRGGYDNAELQVALQPDLTNSIALELPKELVEAYEFYDRLEANEHHGLAEQFSWFPEVISVDYPEFLIDEALLVEQSISYRRKGEVFHLFPGNDNNMPSSGDMQVFSLKNAPRHIPDGYKLLLAFRNAQVGVSEGPHNAQVNLCAYLDMSDPPYDIEKPTERDLPHEFDQRVWKMAANELASSWKRRLFGTPRFQGIRRGQSDFEVPIIDLTDAVNNSSAFQDATGLLFRWETESENAFWLPPPEVVDAGTQPVWIVLKPIEDGV